MDRNRQASQGFMAVRKYSRIEDNSHRVQDILLSLHSVRATYDPRRPFMPWLLAITRNRLADGARRYARTSAREVNADRLDVTFATENANRTADVFGKEELKKAIDTTFPQDSGPLLKC